MTDALTGLRTHRDGLQDAIQSHGAACCLVDIDSLIWLNDQYGHVKGDQALMSVAQWLVRFADARGGSVFRVGGDEFLLLFPSSADQVHVTEFATQIVSGVRALRIPYRRLDRPTRTVLEINAVVLDTAGSFASSAFSEFGLTSLARNWIAKSVFREKARIGCDAGVTVDLFDAPDCPWAA